MRPVRMRNSGGPAKSIVGEAVARTGAYTCAGIAAALVGIGLKTEATIAVITKILEVIARSPRLLLLFWWCGPDDLTALWSR